MKIAMQVVAFIIRAVGMVIASVGLVLMATADGIEEYVRG